MLHKTMYTPVVLTIDELAQQVGMTVRNVRAHHSRGLLPAPQLRGRTAYYGRHHLARLRLIKDMQAAGFNLNAIKRLLDIAAPGSEEDIVRFERALLAPWGPGQPEVVDADELAEQWPQQSSEALRRAVDLGLLVPLADGRFEVPAPRLLKAGTEIARLGIPLERLFGAVEALLTHASAIADEFVRIFLEEVWRPFEEAGAPPERWPGVHLALERLRPLAAEVLTAAFQMTMERAVEQAFGSELGRRTSVTGEQAV